MKKILLSLFTFVVALTSAFADEAKFDFTAPPNTHTCCYSLYRSFYRC